MLDVCSLTLPSRGRQSRVPIVLSRLSAPVRLGSGVFPRPRMMTVRLTVPNVEYEHVSDQRYDKQSVTWFRGVSKEVISFQHWKEFSAWAFALNFPFVSEKCGEQDLTQKQSLMMGMTTIGRRIQTLWWVYLRFVCDMESCNGMVPWFNKNNSELLSAQLFSWTAWFGLSSLSCIFWSPFGPLKCALFSLQFDLR